MAMVGGCGGGERTWQVDIAATHAAAVAISGEAAWEAVTVDADGHAVVEVAEPFVVARSCGTPADSVYFNYYSVFAGPDESTIDVRCALPGVVSLSLAATPNDYQIVLADSFRMIPGELRQVIPFVYDIVALASANFEIHRGVDVTSDTTLGFDPTTNGSPYGQATITLTSGEFAEVSATLTTERGTRVRFVQPPPQVRAIPLAALGPNDHEFAEALAVRGDVQRRVSKPITSLDATYELTLGPELNAAGVIWDTTPRAGWNARDLGTWNRAYLRTVNQRGLGVVDALMLPSYRDALVVDDELIIPDPSGIPGFFPAAELAYLRGQYNWTLEVTRESDGEAVMAAHSGIIDN